MVGKLNILKEKQHKTKKEEEEEEEEKNLAHLWDLKNKIITHLGSWKTNKNKTTRRQKLDPSPMPLEIKIMMCA